jgi:hypothetical protein
MSGMKFDLVPTREELLKRKVQEQVMKGGILKKWEEMNKVQSIEEEWNGMKFDVVSTREELLKRKVDKKEGELE